MSEFVTTTPRGPFVKGSPILAAALGDGVRGGRLSSYGRGTLAYYGCTATFRAPTPSWILRCALGDVEAEPNGPEESLGAISMTRLAELPEAVNTVAPVAA